MNRWALATRPLAPHTPVCIQRVMEVSPHLPLPHNRYGVSSQQALARVLCGGCKARGENRRDWGAPSGLRTALLPFLSRDFEVDARLARNAVLTRMPFLSTDPHWTLALPSSKQRPSPGLPLASPPDPLREADCYLPGSPGPSGPSCLSLLPSGKVTAVCMTLFPSVNCSPPQKLTHCERLGQVPKPPCASVSPSGKNGATSCQQ